MNSLMCCGMRSKSPDTLLATAESRRNAKVKLQLQSVKMAEIALQDTLGNSFSSNRLAWYWYIWEGIVEGAATWWFRLLFIMVSTM